MTTQSAYILRVEGVNFGSTLLDTNDISTIRGAGLALLRIPAAVELAFGRLSLPTPEELFAGASQYAGVFTATDAVARQARDAVAAALAQPGPGATNRDANPNPAPTPGDGVSASATPHDPTYGAEPFHQLSFVVDLVPGVDAPADRLAHAQDVRLPLAEAANRARQFRQWTIVPPPLTRGTTDFDPLERTRPADKRDVWLQDGERQPVSASTLDRRHYGRNARLNFYRAQLPDHAERGNPADGLLFAPSFQHIVANPPPDVRLSARNAIALVYADGNGFGGIRKAVGVRAFASDLDRKRKTLLAGMVDWLRRGQGWDTAPRDDDDRPRDVFSTCVREKDGTNDRFLRFETLLYGGDEFLFVMPSWLALDFVRGLLAATRDWSAPMPAGTPLTHAIGVVICQVKTPIRLTRAIAHDIADAIKETKLKTTDAVGIEVFEGLMPPLDGLDRFRFRLYGPPAAGPDTADVTRLTLMRGDFGLSARGTDGKAVAGDLIARIGSLRDSDALPRSQIHRILAKARNEPGGLRGSEARMLVRRAVDDYARRTNNVAARAALTEGGTRGEALELALIARLWDFVADSDGRPGWGDPAR